MRAIAVPAVLVLLSACAAAPKTLRWAPDEKRIAVSVTLWATQQGPSDSQSKSAMRMMEKRCGGRVKIIEEGTQLRDALVVGLYGGGTMPQNEYYWVGECEKTAADTSSDGDAKAPQR